MAENPLQSYRSLEEIRMRKETLRRELQKDNGQINSLWHRIFHNDKTGTPSKRISGLMSTGAGVVDGVILGWKLYRRFKGKDNHKNTRKKKGGFLSFFK